MNIGYLPILFFMIKREIFMKKLVSLALAALIILPAITLSGCAYDGSGHPKGHRHHGGKM